jgi:hypothetical protein
VDLRAALSHFRIADRHGGEPRVIQDIPREHGSEDDATPSPREIVQHLAAICFKDRVQIASPLGRAGRDQISLRALSAQQSIGVLERLV